MKLCFQTTFLNTQTGGFKQNITVSCHSIHTSNTHRIMYRLTAYPISPKQATFIGLFAVCFWSSVIGLIRTLSLHMGAVGGAAVLYSLATILLLLIFGKPDLRRFSRNYLFWAGIFFVGCELCLSLSIGYADNARQIVEIGMVNYLWPTFTIIGAVWFNKQPAKW